MRTGRATRPGHAPGTGHAPQRATRVQHPVVTTVGMSVILLGVMVPLAVRRYSRLAR